MVRSFVRHIVPERNLMQAENRAVGRRNFLTRTLAGSVAVAFALEGRAKAEYIRDETCKVTLADTLLLFVDLLLDVQQRAIIKESEKTFVTARQCQAALCELSKKIDELKDEICKSPTSRRAQQMQNLVETGRMNAQMIEASASSVDTKFASLATSLDTINGLINQAAQDVETECKFIITEKGKLILGEIWALVKSNSTICGEITRNQELFSKNVRHIRCQIGLVEHFIFQAATAIMDKDVIALKANIEGAIKILLEVDTDAKDQTVDDPSPNDTYVPAPKPPQASGASSSAKPKRTATNQSAAMDDQCTWDIPPPAPPGNPTEILIGLLRGTLVLFEHPAMGRPQNLQGAKMEQDGRRALFVLASAHNAPAMLPEDIGTLLDNYCQPYTYFRRGVLTLAVDVAWASYRKEPGKRLDSIWWTISKMKCKGQSNPGELARRLA